MTQTCHACATDWRETGFASGSVHSVPSEYAIEHAHIHCSPVQPWLRTQRMPRCAQLAWLYVLVARTGGLCTPAAPAHQPKGAEQQFGEQQTVESVGHVAEVKREVKRLDGGGTVYVESV